MRMNWKKKRTAIKFPATQGKKKHRENEIKELKRE